MKFVAQPQISEEEVSLVAETVRSKGLVEGKNARSLEDAFAKFTGVKHAICTVNGTAALHLAIEGLKIPPNSEIITSSFTFIASANSISFGGCIPIFAEIDPETYNIDPEKIEELITPKTKAILPIHIFGLPSDMKAINDIAEEHNLLVIEDACQSHGARIDGKHVGTFGNVGCFSFYATKNMITGEGGMVITNDDELAKVIRSIKNHGRSPQGGYNHYTIGYNYRLADPLAAIGLIQINKLPKMLAQRAKNANAIRKTIDELPSIRTQRIPKGVVHSHYICAPVVEESSNKTAPEIVKELNNKGVGSRQIYAIPCHQQPTYKEGIKSWRWSKYVEYPEYSKLTLPITEKIARSHFEVPIHPGLTEEEVQKIQSVLTEVCN